MEMLVESQLSADCESIKGKYNLVEFVKKRRALLPDCCLPYVEMPLKDRNKCECQATNVLMSEVCSGMLLSLCTMCECMGVSL